MGGQEFDVNNSKAALHDIDNNSLLSKIGDTLVPSDEKGPPVLDHLASIVDAKFLVECDVEKRKEREDVPFSQITVLSKTIQLPAATISKEEVYKEVEQVQKQ